MKNEKLKTVGQILLIPTDLISENPLRARIYYSDAKTDELVRSIEESGIIEPLSVCAAKNGKYVIISGERRFRAAKKLGFGSVPCVLIESRPEKAVVGCLTNNLTHEPLNYFETAASYEKIKEHFGFSYEQTAAKLGLDVKEVLSKVRLLQIPPRLRKTMVEYGLSQRYAAILSRHSDPQKEELLKSIIENRLSLAETKKLSEKMLNPEDEQKHSVQTFFSDVNVFVNTIERAYGTMKNSGIDAKIEKEETEKDVRYLISIPKRG